ncbi:DNA-directed RNA polymerase omega chain [Ehrlichia ruminantium]|uniref:DNA-directed RNA polymerase subunit omega n=1 Tax=Ehrlichia ruminantium TaxID=779 RepID=A0A170RSE9_EHRRU|nr:DNA-directed RNA polymerase subunit omega [Ehrlichia ruminantium]GAT75142.1 DNA-directed RNA polymerase omega chain [Ehrlichia ruminantium]GAT77136.1 DNA-directed RNA polymerase omega chain [Ehrlichia ruminantium]GAT78211.1 DNA-directed RNA polymerase omega chain [Ehrlichia ruminantium]
MARLTVEECMGRTNNKFKLVILASQRAHDLNSGASPVVKHKNSKNTIIALTEIANEQLDVHLLFNLAVQRCRKYMEKFINSDDSYVVHKSKDNIDIFQKNAASNFDEVGANSLNVENSKFLDGDNFFLTQKE